MLSWKRNYSRIPEILPHNLPGYWGCLGFRSRGILVEDTGLGTCLSAVSELSLPLFCYDISYYRNDSYLVYYIYFE